MKPTTKSYLTTFLAAVLAASLALPVMAASKNKLDARVRDLTDYFDAMQKDATKAVPAEILSKAEGLIIMRNYKAGFVVGLAGGGGVAIAKNKATGKWGPVGFLSAGEGSFGYQAGVQRTDLVLVLMNGQALQLLTDPNFKIGGDVRATMGPKSGGDQLNLKTDQSPVLVYGDTKGLFGGAALQTGGLVPDAAGNQEYYGKSLTMKEIVVDQKVEPTEAAKLLAAKIDQYANPAKK